jgi:hypothetical protein
VAFFDLHSLRFVFDNGGSLRSAIIVNIAHLRERIRKLKKWLAELEPKTAALEKKISPAILGGVPRWSAPAVNSTP